MWLMVYSLIPSNGGLLRIYQLMTEEKYQFPSKTRGKDHL